MSNYGFLGLVYATTALVSMNVLELNLSATASFTGFQTDKGNNSSLFLEVGLSDKFSTSAQAKRNRYFASMACVSLAFERHFSKS